MRRVFEIDVVEYPRCRGRMRVLAAIVTPEAIRATLDCLGLPPESAARLAGGPQRAGRLHLRDLIRPPGCGGRSVLGAPSGGCLPCLGASGATSGPFTVHIS